MSYVLESKEEFDRLEYQSMFPKYDYKKELCGFKVPEGGRILDAGCGSGLVSRYLATRHRTAKIVGCDFSEDRVRLAREAAVHFSNVCFETEDLANLSFSQNTFDAVVCRYVLEHLSREVQLLSAKEMYRVLKPAGSLYAIDFDGPMLNLYPQTPLVAKVLSRLEEGDTGVDLRVGRKMPALLCAAGFKNVMWRIETIECKDGYLEDELELIPQKLAGATQFLSSLLGSRDEALEFGRQYIDSLKKPGVVLFYNKFIVTGEKTKKKKRSLEVVK